MCLFQREVKEEEWEEWDAGGNKERWEKEVLKQREGVKKEDERDRKSRWRRSQRNEVERVVTKKGRKVKKGKEGKRKGVRQG